MAKSRNLKISIVLVVILAAIALVAWLVISLNSAGALAKKKHQQAFDVLPEGTFLVISADAKQLTRCAFEELARELGFRLDDPETRTEVGALFEQRLGFDPLKVSSVTFFTWENEVGVLLRGDMEFDPESGRVDEYEGVSMTRLRNDAWATVVGDALAVGQRDVLRALIDVDQGKRKALRGTEGGDAHEAMLAELEEGILVTTVVPNEEMTRDLVRVFGRGAAVTSIGLGLDAKGGGSLVLRADEGTRKMLIKRIESLKDQANEILAAAKKNMDQLDTLPAAGVILADHHMEKLFEMLAPKEVGDTLRVDLTGPGHSSLGLLVGASALTGIPAFIKYTRKAKTAEAVDMLDKIYKGAVDYFITPRVEPNSAGQAFMECQFPDSVPLTPTGSPCDHADELFPANPGAWDHPVWSALRFEIHDAHRFRYSFDSSGAGSMAQFTAHAQADLDCDGNWSTFQRYGKGNSMGGGECRVSQGAALYTYNETE